MCLRELALPLIVTSFVATFSEAQTSVQQTSENPEQQKQVADQTEQPEISTEFRQEIEKLLELNGQTTNRFTILKNSFVGYKRRVPGVPQEFWVECEALLKRQDIIDALIPVYANNFSHEEIIALVAFFESPVGKKFMKKTNLVVQQTNKAMVDMGVNIREQLNKKLDDAGYIR